MRNATQFQPAETPRLVLASLILVLTWVLIASNRVRWLPIGRSAGSLLGGVLVMFLGVMTPEEAYRAVNYDTLSLLLGMMVLSTALERDGVWDACSTLLLAKCSSRRAMMLRVCCVAGSMSALLTNDTTCVFLTPLIVAACKRASLPYGPFLIGLATSSNIGSSALPIGNPQNAIIGTVSKISFLKFAAACGVSAVLGVFLNVGLLLLFYRRHLSSPLVVASHATSDLDLSEREEALRQRAAGISVASSSIIGVGEEQADLDDGSTMRGDRRRSSVGGGSPDVDDDVELAHADLLEEARKMSVGPEDQDLPQSDGDLHMVFLSPATQPSWKRSSRFFKWVQWCVLHPSVGVLALVLILFASGFNMGVVSLLGGVIVLVLDRKDASASLMKVDWLLLLFFGGLFIVIAGVNAQPLVSDVGWKVFKDVVQVKDVRQVAAFSSVTLIASNTVSNVPFVLMVSPHLLRLNAPDTAWLVLAYVSTIAGNLTLIGSVANVIVAERAKESYKLGFFEYLAFGFPSTIVMTLIGTPIVFWLSQL